MNYSAVWVIKYRVPYIRNKYSKIEQDADYAGECQSNKLNQSHVLLLSMPSLMVKNTDPVTQGFDIHSLVQIKYDDSM